MKIYQAALIAALAASLSWVSPAQATSRPLMDGDAVIGKWTLARAGTSGTCSIELSQTNQTQSAKASAACLKALKLKPITAWRGAPDGIALVNKAGETIAFFSPIGKNTYRGIGPDRALTLTRPKP
jgi:hypothetical protein